MDEYFILPSVQLLTSLDRYQFYGPSDKAFDDRNKAKMRCLYVKNGVECQYVCRHDKSPMYDHMGNHLEITHECMYCLKIFTYKSLYTHYRFNHCFGRDIPKWQLRKDNKIIFHQLKIQEQSLLETSYTKGDLSKSELQKFDHLADKSLEMLEAQKYEKKDDEEEVQVAEDLEEFYNIPSVAKLYKIDLNKHYEKTGK